MADIQMPQLGETVTEGTITKWFKAVGDAVAEDEPLFEVSTDKVDSEVPSPVTGTLHRDPGRRRATPSTSAPCWPASATRRGRRRRRRRRRPRRRPSRGAGRARPRRPRPRRPSRGRAAPTPARGRAAGRAAAPSAAAGRAEPAPGPGAAPAPAPAAPQRRRRRRTAAASCCRRSSAGSSPRTTSTRPPSPAPAPAGASPATTCWPCIDQGGARAGRTPRPAQPRRAGPGAGAAAPAPAPAPRRPPGARGRAPGERDTVDPAHQHPPAHRRAHDPLEGDVGPRLRLDRGRLRGASSGCARPHEGRVQGGRGLQPHLPAVHQPGGGRRHPRVPRGQRQLRRERADRPQLREPRHRRRPRLQGPDGAGRPRRRRQAAAGHRPRGQRPRPPGPVEEARPRRHRRRHVHHHQPRPVRHDA